MNIGTGLACIFGGLLTGHMLGHLAEDQTLDPPLTCEVATTKVWATQQCLKFQPGCKINKGPELFTEYKQMKDFVAEHCPEEGDDFSSQ